jgi:hypothetical protein
LKLSADQPLFTVPVKGSRRIAGTPGRGDPAAKRCFSATLKFEINRSRARGLRKHTIYGLSRDQIEFL